MTGGRPGMIRKFRTTPPRRRLAVGLTTILAGLVAVFIVATTGAARTMGPSSLSSVTLFEAFGELVDAAGGVLEFSDLLKRPLDAFKYLQITAETGEVPLRTQNVPLLFTIRWSNEGGSNRHLPLAKHSAKMM